MEKFDRQPPIRKAVFENAGNKPITVKMFNGPEAPVDETEVKPNEKVKMPVLLRPSLERQGLRFVDGSESMPRAEIAPDPRDEKIANLEVQVQKLMDALKTNGALGAVQEAKSSDKGGKESKGSK